VCFCLCVYPLLRCLAVFLLCSAGVGCRVIRLLCGRLRMPYGMRFLKPSSPLFLSVLVSSLSPSSLEPFSSPLFLSLSSLLLPFIAGRRRTWRAAREAPSQSCSPPPSMCVHACVLVHVCMCACVHVCMCACVHVCMCACVHSTNYTILRFSQN
jgi:hypothetical protein